MLIVISTLFVFVLMSNVGSNITNASTINSKLQVTKTKNASSISAENVLDCSVYESSEESILPPLNDVFQFGTDIRVPAVDGAEYIDGIWSPKGDMVIMSIPDGGIKVEEHDTVPSDEPSPLFAVGTSSLYLYTLADDSLQLIAQNGRKPAWSTDSDSVYFFQNTVLMKYDLNSRSITETGSSISSSGVSLLFSRPLPDGQVLAPQSLSEVQISELDQVLVSPKGDKFVVGHASNTYKGTFTPAITILYDSTGHTKTLLRNCQYSAAGIDWSSAGDKIAYPVHSNYPEIRVYDLESDVTNIIVRLDGFSHLGGISWSPNGKFILFTDFDDNSLWIVSIDGSIRQRLLTEVYAPRWSPDSTHLLFARDDAEWHIVEINQK